MGLAYPSTLFRTWIQKPEDAGRQDTANAHLNEILAQQVTPAALSALALEYESVAFAGAVEEPSLGAALAPPRRPDLRKALSRMLCHEWEDGYLIYQLVVEGAEPGRVAAERGVSRAALVEQLRDAVGSLASQYEHLANGHLNDLPLASLRQAVARREGPA
jgi:hypothetical protein